MEVIASDQALLLTIKIITQGEWWQCIILGFSPRLWKRWEWLGEFVTTPIDFFLHLTVKAQGVIVPKRPGKNTWTVRIYGLTFLASVR